MKIFPIILFSIFVPRYGDSQTITSLSINRPSAVVSEWYNRNSTFTYIITRVDSISRQAIVKSELKQADGTPIASLDLTQMPVLNLPQGTTVLYARDISIELLTFTDNVRSTIQRSGRLPAGTYTLDVQLVNPQTLEALTQVQSRTFNLAALQLPFLIMPQNNSELNAEAAKTSIIFRWTPLVPRQQEVTSYRLQVFAILPFQQPMQALRGNQPLLDVTLKEMRQYIWRPLLPFTTDTTINKFIWTIQTLTAENEPVITTDGNGESRSEPFMFYLRNKD